VQTGFCLKVVEFDHFEIRVIAFGPRGIQNENGKIQPVIFQFRKRS
jgi:hypothetical protein